MSDAVEVLKQLVMDYKQLIMEGDNDLWQERLMANIMDAQQVLANESGGKHISEQFEFDFNK
jgi:hypothetical protein